MYLCLSRLPKIKNISCHLSEDMVTKTQCIIKITSSTNIIPYKFNTVSFYLKICPSLTLSLNVENNQQYQKWWTCVKCSKVSYPWPNKNNLVNRKISIQLTKSGSSLKLKNFCYHTFSSFFIFLIQRKWENSPFYQNVSLKSLR